MNTMTIRAIFKLGFLLSFFFMLPKLSNGQSGFADVTITSTATSGGTWNAAPASGAGPYIFTPNASVNSANILITDIQDRMGFTNSAAAEVNANNVTILTTSAGGNGNGDITVGNTGVTTDLRHFINMTGAGGSAPAAAYVLTLNANRNITFNSAISLFGWPGGNAEPGRLAHSLTLIASGNVAVPFAVDAFGSSAGGGGGSSGTKYGGNGGNITLTAGSSGSLKISAAITTSGGLGTNGVGGTAGTVSITGPGGVTISAGLTMNGGNPSGAGFANGNGGNITINDGAGTVTTGGSTNDGQTAGIIASVAGTGGTGGTGGSLTKSGAGVLMLSQLNTYTGITSVDAGYLRASSNNIVASTSGPFGNNAGGLNLNGGTIRSNVTTFSRPITVTATNSGIDAYGSSRTISSAITDATVSSTFNLNIGGTTVASAEGQDLVLSGIISNSSGTLSITKIGTSNLTLSGANTFSGGTILSAGQLNINHATAIGSGALTISGGILDNTSAGSISFSNNNIQNWNGDFTFTGTQSINMGTGAITLTGNRQITVNANTLTIGGTINQSTLNLTKAGSGTLGFGSQSITLNNITSNAGTLISTSGSLNLAGNFSNNGTFTNNSGSVSFIGTSSQSSGGITFNSLTINKATGQFSLNANTILNGTLTFISGKLDLDIYDLIMGSGSTISGASSSNYIIAGNTGTLKQLIAASGTKTFPVGTSSDYLPATISLTAGSVADTFSTRVLNEVRSSGTTGSIMTSSLVNSTWYITEATAGGSDATLTLQWPLSEELSGFTRSSCRLAQYTGGMWDYGSGNLSALGTDPYTLTRGNITTLTIFAIGNINVLPVTLINFSAKNTGDQNFIFWATATEVNNDYFTIEKSRDGITFETLNIVKGAGHSASIKKYNAIDNEPFFGTTYYRLMQTDYNGKSTKSAIVGVETKKSITLTLEVFPNPGNRSNTSIIINAYGNTTVVLRVYDFTGKEVYAESIDIENKKNTLDIILPENKLNTGVYLVTATQGNNSQSKKLIIK